MASWNEKNVIITYDLARTGYSQSQIALVLGITVQTFINWKRKYPLLRYALRKGYAIRKNGNGFNFSDYVYGRLPDNLKKVWDDIHKFENEKGGIAKIEAMLEKAGKRVRQCLLIHALMVDNFNLTKACEKVNITRQIFYHWKENDPEFAALADEVVECKKDFFEEHLVMLVASGDSPATVMANRTLNRDRGYGEHIKHELNGVINHAVVRVDDLNLPLDTRKQILSSIRKQIESREVEYNGEE